METRRIRTILDVDAGPAVAGFRRGEAAVAGFGNSVRRQNATLASTAGASRTAANSITGLNTAAAATSGSMRGLSTGMAASAAGATALGSGMKSSANSVTGLTAATAGAKSSLSTFGQTAVTATSLASGGMKTAASAATGFKAKTVDAFTGLNTSIRTNRDEWSKLSTGAVVAGGLIAGGLALMSKAAIDWESDFAGVKKTVDDSTAGYAELEGELRGLAKTLPSTHKEIAAVAEAAGQLGIERDNITSFTKTMIDMGQSTNLSAEEAASGMARFANVMGTSQTEFSNIGSSMVELGNNFATTEGEILAMAQRLSGAGRQANMTEGDVLGMATALSSVGIAAESGGTAFSRVILEMGKSVDTGSEKLETFARTAGMSAESFSKLWQENSGEAMQRFITGLGDMQARGESLEPVLAELGMTDIRVGDALRRSASSADLFTDAMTTGNEAYKTNSALADEAAQRYDTTASKLAMARNAAKDAAIDFGAVLAPAIASAASGAADAAGLFASMPGPLKSIASGTAATAAGVLLVGGAAVKATAGVQSLNASLEALNLTAGGTKGTLKALAGVAAVVGAAFAASELRGWADRAAVATVEAEDLGRALSDMGGKSSEATGALADLFREHDGGVSGLFRSREEFVSTGEAIERFGFLADEATRTDVEGRIARWMEGTEAFDKSVASLDQAIAGMARSGDIEGAQRALDQMLSGVAPENVEAVRAKFEETNMVLGQTGDAATGAADGTGEFATELDVVEGAAEDAQGAVDELSDAITGLGDAMLGVEASEDSYLSALQKTKDALAENGANLNKNTEAGRANRAVLRDLANENQEWAAEVLRSTGSVEQAQGVLDKGKQSWIAMRDEMGANKKETRELADALFNLDGIEAVAEVRAETEEAQAKADAFKAKVDLVDGSRGRAILTQQGAELAAASTQGFYDALMQVDGTHANAVLTEKGAALAKKSTQGFYDSLMVVGSTSVTAGVHEKGATPSKGRVDALDGSIRGLDGKRVNVDEQGATPSKDRVRGLDWSIRGLSGKSVDVSARVSGQSYVDNLRWAIAGLHSKSITVTTFQQTLYRNNAPGRSPGPWRADGGIDVKGAGGGLHQYMADGGTIGSFVGQQPQIRRAGGAGVTWAEDGAGPWEAWISGHPAKSARSKSIWLETGRKLGMIQAMADGGVRQMSPHADRTYVPPTPAPLVMQAPAQGQGNVIARLHPDDAALLAEVASRPVSVDVDGRALARANTAATRRHGAARTGARD